MVMTKMIAIPHIEPLSNEYPRCLSHCDGWITLIFSLFLAWASCWTNCRVGGYLTHHNTYVTSITLLYQRNSLWLSNTDGDIHLAQQYFRQWPFASHHQGITWTSVDLLSVRSSNFLMGAISQEIPRATFAKISLKIIILKCNLNLPGANELGAGIIQ